MSEKDGIKRHRLGSLPGSARNLVDTIIKCLKFVEERKPSESEFQEWFLRELPSVKSKRLVRDYTRTIENLGLMIRSRDRFTLSEKAKEFLRSRDKNILYETLDKRYVAVHEILELLREKPSTREEIASFLENKIGVKWQTRTQYSLRLSWLLSLGYVTKNGRYYSLTEEGRNIVENENEMIEESPTHPEIKNRVADTGKLLGYFSEKEYKIEGHVLDVVWKEIEEGDPAFVFEILLEGSLSDALVRLKYAHHRFGGPKLYLVTDRRYMSQAGNVIRTSFREIADSIRVVHWKDIDELKETSIKFLGTARKIKFTPKILLRQAARVKLLPLKKAPKTKEGKSP